MSDSTPRTLKPSLSVWFPTFQRIISRLTSRDNPAQRKINDSELPERLKQAASRFVNQSDWPRTKSPLLANTMLTHLIRQIERGVNTDALIAQWSEVVPLPYLRKLQDPTLLAIYSLPPAVAQLIIQIVQRTRLWRSEQIDVARELISHFQEAADAGLTSEELVHDFGDPEAAARLIGRAKRRNRPLIWRAFKRLTQFFGLVLLIFTSWYMWLLFRFQFTRPTVVHDYIGQIDARSRALPESDRAWPLYAQAMSNVCVKNTFPLTPETEANLVAQWAGLGKRVDVQRIENRIVKTWPVDENGAGAPERTEGVRREMQLDMQVYSTGLDELSTGKHWPAMVQYAEMNQESIRLILRGSTKPSLGFIYRDPANAEWLTITNSGNYEHFKSASESALIGVLLPHLQSIRSFEHLLRIEVERARLAGDREQVISVLTALLKIAIQIDHADQIAVEKMIAQIFARRSWSMTRRILSEQPDFFTDGDLQQIAHQIAAYRSEVDLMIPIDLRKFSDDLLQRIYSDDGHGNGHLTAEGWQLLLKQEQLWRATSNSAAQTSSTMTQLEGVLLSGAIASRQEAKRLLDRFQEMDDQEISHPLWEIDLAAKPAANALMQSILSTSSGQRKFGRLAKLFPFTTNESYYSPSAFVLLGESSKMQCDATLTALALELYHRRHQAWPDQLDQLCPDLLPSVPLDRFDGKPMKYRMIDGKPVIYSVGRNQTDENGTWSAENKNGTELAIGDWRLWPVWPSDN